MVVGAGLPLAAVAQPVMTNDKYWEAQWLINEYEQDAQDMRNHLASKKMSPLARHITNELA